MLIFHFLKIFYNNGHINQLNHLEYAQKDHILLKKKDKVMIKNKNKNVLKKD